MTIKKLCRKCKKEFPATLEFFYKHSGGKYGITPRCKSCVNDDNAKSHAKRLSQNPEHVKKLATKRAKKSYWKDPEKSRAYQREAARKRLTDPTKRKEIYSKKRGGYAGLSGEEIDLIKERQQNCCAICGDSDPTDLDHCHTTGQVRWLLCRHCNRGLGAFRDRPDLLRKAANMLQETIEPACYTGKYNNQGDYPNEAIT